jgi:CRISPR system Cascade subunit CasA
MNLVKDVWLPCKFKDGSVKEIAIAEIANPDVIDLALPRADFQGAAYQLLIGLLQTVMAPENRKEWHQRYNNPPTKDELQKQLDKVAHAFNVTGDGPLFMQDFDPLEDVKNATSVAALLIDAPGGKTIKDNTDHFVKRGGSDALSVPMAALALFTLQINAPSGGQGHRVGLRGGGPLTSLVLPAGEQSPLWQKIWLNVICKRFWSYEEPVLTSAKVFPWLGETKISRGENTEVYASDVHPLAMYWAMPRRIRLIIEEKDTVCDISGNPTANCVHSYRTQNYGNNYAGAWRHPLTAYRFDPKKPEDIPNSVKAQPGGVTYGYWDFLTLTDAEQGQQASLNVEHFYYVNRRKEESLGFLPRLWCSGYDMDNMKARCWYEKEIPILNVELELQADFLRAVKELQELINKLRLELNKRIKEAWFERPGDAKGDTTFIAAEFWRRTENIFFNAVQSLSEQESYYPLSTEAASAWLKEIQKTVTDLFDEYTLSVDIGDPRTLKRVMKARRFLSIWVYGGRDIKNFKQQHAIDTKKEVA